MLSKTVIILYGIPVEKIFWDISAFLQSPTSQDNVYESKWKIRIGEFILSVHSKHHSELCFLIHIIILYSQTKYMSLTQ